MKHSLFCLFLFWSCLNISAQHMLSRQFPFFNQLLSNEIYDLHQDKEGYLWIATIDDGLARYDGYQLLNFRSDYKNQNLLADNGVRNIDDNHLYVWIATWRGLNLYDKQTCRIIPFPDKQLRDIYIAYVAIDKQGDGWVGANDMIYRCDPTGHILKEYKFNTREGEIRSVINTIYVDSKGYIWAMTQNGVFGYDAATDSFRHYPCPEMGDTAYTMCHDRSGNYWVATWGTGLWQFFPDKEGEECFMRPIINKEKNNAGESIVFSIEQDDTFGYLWMLSYGGLHVLKYTDRGTLEDVDINNLVDTHMMYSRLCKDKEGNLWLGSWDRAYTIFFDNSNVDNYALPQVKEHMGWDTNILNLCLDNDSIMWFEQDRYGLCLYDLRNDRFQTTQVGAVNIITQSRHKPGVWVNSRYNPRIMRLAQRGMKVNIEEDFNIDGVTGLIEDNAGNLWISSWSNLQVKRPDSNELVVTDENTPRMSLLANDTKNAIWGISGNNEIFRLRCTDGKIICELQGSISSLLEREKINGFNIDSEERVWINTSFGRILRSDSARGEFRNMPLHNQVNDCTVLGMLSDENNVWIIANKKILQYNAHSGANLTYSTTDENIMVDVFRSNAISLDGNGGLYAGGHPGFIHIRSKAETSVSSVHPHLRVTDVKVEDKSIFFDRDPGKNTVQRIFLEPNDRNIEIQLSPLLYALNNRFRLSYRLEGIDHNWLSLDNKRFSIFYNRLPKGTYKLYIRNEYVQDKQIEEEVILTIVRNPAFYETWLAYLIYILLIGLCFYLIARFYIRRIKRKSELKLQEELTRTKLTYFTNVSHELLTPLTVISCISDYMTQKVPTAQQQAVMLKANVEKLKRLIQQVLDFRKMDVGKLKLNVSEGNIREFILNVCRINFLPLAQKKNIKLETHIEPEELRGFVDFDKLDKMLHNLLSNAIKYTRPNNNIYVSAKTTVEAGHRVLSVAIADEGIGIPAGELEYIFTRFYNSKKNRGIESNGIGLSLTKELVELHHGAITVESTPGKGTRFTIVLPIDKENYSPDEWAADDESVDAAIDAQASIFVVANEENDLPDDTPDKPTVLLIDDNVELLTIMQETFKERYKVLTAADGQQAWNKLANNETDIIICDVMLPDTNGWDLSRRIKSDLRFNHIPIIILTAKNGIDDRVTSYEAGADGYVAKPFDSKILFARVDNLIKAYRMRQNAFRKEENVNLETLTYPSADKKFLQSIIDSIEQHLEEPEFDLEKLASELNMSKSTLYRKIKSMTGMTPLDFVRNIKMKRACMMLLTETKNISEVAYAVGFSTRKYFTKCFKEEFDITPSEFLQKHLKN